MFSLSWPELHGALTHFPVALLIGSVAFDFGATLWKKAEWRVVSFWMLALAVAMAIPSLATGLLAGNTIYTSPSLPPVFVWHRALAFASSGLAWLLLFWRHKIGDGEFQNTGIGNDDANSPSRANAKTRIETKNRGRGALLLVSLLAAIAVGVTGHFGGQMVFGSDSSSSNASSSAASKEKTGEKSAKSGDKSSTRNPQFVALDAKLVKQGAAVYVAQSCASCHKMNGVGGKNGPDLTHIGSDESSVEWQIAHLKNPRSKNPNSSMPAYDYLPPQDLKALATFLVSKK